MKVAAYLFFVFLILVQCGKKETIAVTNENKKEVLLEYGRQNPEKNVTIETSYGEIRLKLYDETPLHRANFVKLIKDEYYDEAEFYRIVEKFVVQGGVPMKKLDYTVPAEINTQFYHKKGALGMARLDDNNPGKESSSTEFFIWMLRVNLNRGNFINHVKAFNHFSENGVLPIQRHFTTDCCIKFSLLSGCFQPHVSFLLLIFPVSVFISMNDIKFC